MNFSLQNGLVAPEEAEKMKKEMEIVKKLQGGGMAGPGGCKGPQECQAYCSDQSHIEECMNFATQNGMVNKDDATMRMEQVQGAQMRMQAGEYDRQRFAMPPGGEMGPPPEGWQGGQPPEGWKPPEGMMQPPPTNMQPPPNMMPPPTGGFMPPEGFIPPQGMMPPQGFTPPEGMMQPPPTNMMPPSGMMPPPEFQSAPPPPPPSEPMPITNLPGLVLKPFLDIFQYFR